MGSSAPTASEWLSRTAERLGAADPSALFGAGLERALPPRLGRPAGQESTLIPGYVPFELSFSEAAPATLRFDFEPLGWGNSRAQVRQVTTTAIGAIAARRWGSARGKAFSARAATTGTGGGGFGAFAGASFDASGMREAKAYYPGGAPDGPAATLAAAAREEIEGLESLMHSVSVADGALAERAYEVCRGQLDLLSLQPLLARLGLGFRAPELIVTLSRLTGGAAALGPGCAVIGLRPRPSGAEVKIEVAAVALGERPLAAVDAGLVERPAARAAFHRWLAALELPGMRKRATVISARVRREQGVRLSAYVHPVAAASGQGEE